MENWQLGNLEVDSPWGNAGGVLKSVEDVEAMARTGVGWLEPGSYTLERRVGNAKDHGPEEADKVVYHYNQLTGDSTNSLGMPNEGMDVVEQEIPEMARIAHASKKKLVVNVAPVSTDPIEESRELVARAFEAGADMVLLNPACPNIYKEDGSKHDRLSDDPKAVRAVLAGLKSITQSYGRIGIRLAPIPNYDEMKVMIRNIQSTETVSTIWTPNTWAGNVPLDEDGAYILDTPDHAGGRSGPATAEEAYAQAVWAKDILNGCDITLVSSGGTANNENIGASASRQLRKVLQLGALGAGTTFYYQPKDGWVEDTDRLLMAIAGD
jgi:dihydroorotate dehydrogenase